MNYYKIIFILILLLASVNFESTIIISSSDEKIIKGKYDINQNELIPIISQISKGSILSESPSTSVIAVLRALMNFV